MKQTKKVKQSKLSLDQLNEIKQKSAIYKNEQECCCLGLLLLHGMEFTILKPRKLPKQDNQYLPSFFEIKEIHLNNKSIPFHKIIEDEILSAESLWKKNDDLTTIKKKKYQHKNLISSTNNYLIQLLRQYNYSIEIKSTRQTKYILKMNRIESIQQNEIGILSSNQISSIGNIIFQKIIEIFQSLSIKGGNPLKITKESVENIENLFEIVSNTNIEN